MILPIGHEEPSVRRLPWVTFGIMAVCAAVLLLMQLRGGPENLEQWGLVTSNLRAVDFLSYMFLHAGWAHLVGNFVILLLAGPPLEDRWGRPLFAAFYVSAGVAAAGCYALMSRDSAIPMVGASGAAAALMGAVLVRFGSTKVRIFYIFWAMRLFKGTFWAPAWAILPVWFVNELVFAVITVRGPGSAGAAYWCHVGGFLFGLGVAFGMRHWRLEARHLDAAIESKVTLAHNPLIDEAMNLRIAGDPEAAYRLLREAVEAHPNDPDLISAYWELACEQGRSADAAPNMVGLVAKSLARGEAAVAARTWQEISQRGPALSVDRQLLVRLVPALLEAGNQSGAVQALRQVVDPAGGPIPTGMAFRVLELAKDLDPPTALCAARRALEADGLHISKRERIEALAASLSERCASLPVPEAAEPEAEACESSSSEDLSIPLEYDAVYDFTLPSDSAGPAGPQLRELDASGSLVETDSDVELIPDSLPLEQWTASPPPPPVVPMSDSSPLPEIAPAPRSGARQGGMPPPAPAVPPPVPEAKRLADSLAFEASDSVARFCGVKAIEAVLLEVGDGGVTVQRTGGGRGRVAYDAIGAIAVAAVNGLASKPVLVVDLIANWNDSGGGPLQLVRLRSDAFDARAFVPGATRSVDAFRALLEQLLARTGAVPLPDVDGVRGRPFGRYADLESYQREVLLVDA